MTRFAMFFAFLLWTSSASAQAGLWQQVGPSYKQTRLNPADLSPSQRSSVIALFKAKKQLDAWDCPAEQQEELLNGLSFESISLAANQNTILIEAGTGCARGGQGANGAMWLVRLDKTGPVLLANPEARFSGWVYSVQPTTSHGYRDVILGWHMSASEMGLQYFRFDGRSYRSIGSATAGFGHDGRMTIRPDKPPTPR